MIFASAARCLIADLPRIWKARVSGRLAAGRPGLPEHSPEEGLLGGCWVSSSRNSQGGVFEEWLLKPPPPCLWVTASPSHRAMRLAPLPEKVVTFAFNAALILCHWMSPGLSPGILHCKIITAAPSFFLNLLPQQTHSAPCAQNRPPRHAQLLGECAVGEGWGRPISSPTVLSPALALPWGLRHTIPDSRRFPLGSFLGMIYSQR